MFVGHFALAVASKRVLPRFSVFSLMVACQLLDLVFLLLFPFKIEYFTLANPQHHGQFGNLWIHAGYTHSLLGALFLSLLAFGIAKLIFKRETKMALGFSILVFSHWILDILVHRADMPLLPNNFGNLPMIGMGLWNLPWLVWGLELFMAVAAIGIYIRYQKNLSPISPIKKWIYRILVIAFLLLLSAADLADLLKS